MGGPTGSLTEEEEGEEGGDSQLRRQQKIIGLSNTLRLRSFHYSLFQTDYSAAIQVCSINPVMKKRVNHRETRRHMQGRLC
jgi:hypothetical protein